MNRYVLVTCLVVFFHLGCSHAQSQVDTASTNTHASANDNLNANQLNSDQLEELRFLTIINQFRTELGLNKLTINPMAQAAAEKHSEWMDINNKITHLGPSLDQGSADRMKLEGLSRYDLLGENVACGNADALDTFTQWLYSLGHLKNMMHPQYTAIGIARRGKFSVQGECPYYWTTDFVSLADDEEVNAVISEEMLIHAASVVLGKKPDLEQLVLPVEWAPESIETQ